MATSWKAPPKAQAQPQAQQQQLGGAYQPQSQSFNEFDHSDMEAFVDDMVHDESADDVWQYYSSMIPALNVEPQAAAAPPSNEMTINFTANSNPSSLKALQELINVAALTVQSAGTGAKFNITLADAQPAATGQQQQQQTSSSVESSSSAMPMIDAMSFGLQGLQLSTLAGAPVNTGIFPRPVARDGVSVTTNNATFKTSASLTQKAPLLPGGLLPAQASVLGLSAVMGGGEDVATLPVTFAPPQPSIHPYVVPSNPVAAGGATYRAPLAGVRPPVASSSVPILPSPPPTVRPAVRPAPAVSEAAAVYLSHSQLAAGDSGSSPSTSTSNGISGTVTPTKTPVSPPVVTGARPVRPVRPAEAPAVKIVVPPPAVAPTIPAPAQAPAAALQSTVAPATNSEIVTSAAEVAKSVANRGVMTKELLLARVNPKTFPTKPEFARFFVIKSFSEDDIHKSIKFSIWASTKQGNARLDTAFKESASKGPIYLFFSVNGSGHFQGMAQMLSPVDYNSSSTVWAQDIWKGIFEVRWIFIKDIPNKEFRHITLPNNENKPVTNSRDTQEVFLEHGRKVLEIFAKYAARLSILDDFTEYDQRKPTPSNVLVPTPAPAPAASSDSSSSSSAKGGKKGGSAV